MRNSTVIEGAGRSSGCGVLYYNEVQRLIGEWQDRDADEQRLTTPQLIEELVRLRELYGTEPVPLACNDLPETD